MSAFANNVSRALIVQSAIVLATVLPLLVNPSYAAGDESEVVAQRLVPVANDLDITSPSVFSGDDFEAPCERCAVPWGQHQMLESHKDRSGQHANCYSDNGTELHTLGGSTGYQGRAYSGGFSGRGSDGAYGGYRNSSVELQTGIRGMRISEWPSSTTGLTLSEEQQLSTFHGTHLQPCQSCGQGIIAPVSTPNYLRPIKKPYLNIPEYVW